MKALGVVERGLVAQANLSYCRALEIAWLRRVVTASGPIWVGAHWSGFPRVLLWLAFLVQGLCLVMAAAHGLLERRWSHRAAQIEAPTMIETPWTRWDEVRSALWYGLATVSIVPWIYAGLDRALPVPLRSTLEALAWAVLVLLAAAETAAARSHERP